MNDKEKLRDAVRNVLRQRGVTQGEAAAAIQATDSSLRVWLSRNKFPKNILIPLARFCGLPSDQDTLKNEYDFEVGSEYATMPGMAATSGRPTQDGMQRVLEILKEAQGHENPEQLVVHLHSSIGFHTGTQSQLAREIAKFLRRGTSVVFLASTWAWGTKVASLPFDPDWIRKVLSAPFDDKDVDEDWALSPSEKDRLYWGVGGSAELPAPFPCLVARVGCVSHLAEADYENSSAKCLTTAMLSRAKLIDMWVEVSPYVSTSPDAALPKSQWTLISSESLELCEKIQKAYWQALGDSGCTLENLFAP